MIKKISWVMLTHNRAATVAKAFNHSLNECLTMPGLKNNYSIEIIWVDNGSEELELEKLSHVFRHANVKILNSDNLGVARGYNQGLAMATGDYIVITGCDRLMPKCWLGRWLLAMEKFPETGVISTYTKPINQVPERKRDYVPYNTDFDYIPAMPLEARIMSRDVLLTAGYMHEGFGLYGHEDLEWADRLDRVARKSDLVNYILPDMIAEHLGTEGVNDWDGKDDKEYHEFKQKEAKDPKKEELLQKLRAQGNPYYNPFA